MKILIIQQKMIGDVLTSSILFKALRELYPEAELHYLIKKHTFAVVENNPMIDNIIFDQEDFEGAEISFLKFAHLLRAQNFTAVIDAYSKIGSALLSFYSGAKIRSGRAKWYTRAFYTTSSTYESIQVNKAGLAIQFRLKLAACLGLDQTIPYQPEIYLSDLEITEAKEFLKSFKIDLSKPLIMIGVLGSNPQKTYPLSYLAELLETLIATSDAQLLFNYIPSQLAEVKKLYKLCSPKVQAKIFLNCYAKSLRKFIAICHHCDALVGNEGGAIHMAKAVGTRTFAIYAPQIETKAWSFEEDKIHSSAHLQHFKPQLFKHLKSQKEILAENHNLYQNFTPDLIKPDLMRFLKNLTPYEV
ncbi:glycosyltransferase family 9 protein [Leeuwenhoekiella sp. NPDC079379]|uniref:glycosyltransferase family 9 protein n=1 Tax=Leeuwenhoekiella sp. NPDC079379 TaxID=3364122 RepID=UPI0037C81730